MRIGAVEAQALKLCVLGCAPLEMARTLDRLCDAGWIDTQGVPTASGKAAWAGHVQELSDDAIQRNVLPSVRPDALVALGRLAASERLDARDEALIGRHETLAVWSRERQCWEITAMGRRVVQLAHLTVE